jgi:hypothetical protein
MLLLCLFFFAVLALAADILVLILFYVLNIFCVLIFFLVFVKVHVLFIVGKSVHEFGVPLAYSTNLLVVSTAMCDSTAQTIIQGQFAINLSHPQIEAPGNNPISHVLGRLCAIRIRDQYTNS